MTANNIDELVEGNIDENTLQQYLGDQFKQYNPKDSGPNEFDVSRGTYLQYATQTQACLFNQGIATKDLAGIRKLIRQCIVRWGKRGLTGLSIADWACGSGFKGVDVYQLLGAEEKLCQIDASPAMTKKSRRNAAEKGIDPEKVVYINANLEEEPTRILERAEDKPYFHLFLGNTIANPYRPEELIKYIAANMKEGECFLLERFKNKKKHYNTPADRQFVVSYLEALGISQEHVTDKDGKIDYFVREVPEGKNSTERKLFQCCLRVHQEYVHPETGKKLSPGDKIIGTRSERFEEKEVQKLFKKAGLEAVVLGRREDYSGREEFLRQSEYRNKRYALFRKKSNLFQRLFSAAFA